MSLKPSYKPLEITLAVRGKLKKHLREDAGISGTTLAKMGNGEYVSLSVIARICEYLECDVQDVVTFNGGRYLSNRGSDSISIRDPHNSHSPLISDNDLVVALNRLITEGNN